MNTITRHLCMASISALGMLAFTSSAQVTSAAEPAKAKPAEKVPAAPKHNHNGVSPSSVRTIQTDHGPARAPMGHDEGLTGAVLLFKETTVSTGEILDIEPAHLEFQFKNTGGEPLEFRLIKPACGCTAPEMEKKIYAPGESGTIKVTFDPSGKRGNVSRNITVYTNSSAKPVHTLFVQSTVKQAVILEPRVLAFEMTQKGQKVSKDIKIFGRFPEFKVSRATTQDSDIFGIEIIDGGEVEHEGETLWLQILRVTISETARPDNHRTEITVRTNDEHRPIFSLSAIGRVIGDLQLTPVRMTMGRLVVGDEFEREITLRSKAGKSFEIKSVNSTNVALDAIYEFEPIDAEKRNEWIVRIKGTVLNPAPRFNAQMNVVTDVADEETLTIQMYGQLQPKTAQSPQKTIQVNPAAGKPTED